MSVCEFLAKSGNSCTTNGKIILLSLKLAKELRGGVFIVFLIKNEKNF